MNMKNYSPLEKYKQKVDNIGLYCPSSYSVALFYSTFLTEHELLNTLRASREFFFHVLLNSNVDMTFDYLKIKLVIVLNWLKLVATF